MFLSLSFCASVCVCVHCRSTHCRKVRGSMRARTMISPTTRSWPINSHRTGRTNIMEAAAVSGARLALSSLVLSCLVVSCPVVYCHILSYLLLGTVPSLLTHLLSSLSPFLFFLSLLCSIFVCTASYRPRIMSASSTLHAHFLLWHPHPFLTPPPSPLPSYPLLLLFSIL